MIKAFAGQHLLSVQDLSLEAVETVFSVADRMVPFAERRMVTRVLEGAILGNMFFEPSTRTRVSFGCAFNLLGGRYGKRSAWRALPWLRGNRWKIRLGCYLVTATSS